MAGELWYTRVRGLVRGPFSLEELKHQRAVGQLARFHEVSSDKVVWQPAASISEVFEAPQESGGLWAAAEEPLDIDELLERSSPVGATEPLGAIEPEPAWHYTIGGEQHGPVSLETIESLLTSGALTERDLLWQNGWANWRAVEDVPEVGHLLWQRQASAAPLRRLPPTAPGVSQVAQPDLNTPSPLLMALLSGCCLIGLGQMVLGQVGKGIVIMAGAVILAFVTAGFSIFVTFPLAAIDAYMVAQKLRSGRSVAAWECFPT